MELALGLGWSKLNLIEFLYLLLVMGLAKKCQAARTRSESGLFWKALSWFWQ